ncbi:MAG: histidinol dehydrogenase [Verrucomicrobia bacterium]|nr:histidinol dehydrogenase [Verrucomicrobiota bacterium]
MHCGIYDAYGKDHRRRHATCPSGSFHRERRNRSRALSSGCRLTVDQFQRRTSVVEYNRISLRKALGAVERFAALEGLSAHGKSADIRHNA